jgi:hypothetical protein
MGALHPETRRILPVLRAQSPESAQRLRQVPFTRKAMAAGRRFRSRFPSGPLLRLPKQPLGQRQGRIIVS